MIRYPNSNVQVLRLLLHYYNYYIVEVEKTRSLFFSLLFSWILNADDPFYRELKPPHKH